MPQCKAKSTRSGERCQKMATKGMEVCFKHGARTLKGKASGTYKHGRYSRYNLPERMAESFFNAQNDPTILDQRDDISLITSRLENLLTRVDTGESGLVWKELKKTQRHFERAMNNQDTASMRTHLTEMRNLIDTGSNDHAAWDEIRQLLEQRRKTVESERKRYVELNQMITNERALALFAQIAESIKRNVNDPHELTAIITDIGRIGNTGLFGPPSGDRP